MAPKLLDPFDCYPERAGLFENINFRFNPPQPHEPSRLSEIPVEQGQISPWGVVSDIAD